MGAPRYQVALTDAAQTRSPTAARDQSVRRRGSPLWTRPRVFGRRCVDAPPMSNLVRCLCEQQFPFVNRVRQCGACSYDTATK
jgi:hypothetical protein